jgi:hypothetical protein
MEQHTGILRQYFGEAAWAEWKSRRAVKAPDEWRMLYRDIAAVLGDDIRSPRARALAARWMALVDLEADGDAAIRTGLIKAWVAGHRLPTVLGVEGDDESVARATRFVADVLWAQRDDDLRGRPPDAAPPKASESQIALFRRAEALVGTDPAGPAARELVADWDEWLVREANGDPETLRMMRLTVARRQAWPDGMRRYVASLVGATPKRWEEVADWLDRAREAHRPR